MDGEEIKSTGDRTLIDIDLDGKRRRISVSREAIEDYRRLSPDAAGSMSSEDMQEFVRQHLPLVIAAAKRKLGVTSESAELIMIRSGEL